MRSNENSGQRLMVVCMLLVTCNTIFNSVELWRRGVWMAESDAATESLMLASKGDLQLMRQALEVAINQKTDDRIRKSEVAQTLIFLRDTGQLRQLPAWVDSKSVERR